MPDYSKSLIYKLCCKDPTITDIYIGSTTNFRTRKNLHKCRNNTEDPSPIYKFIRSNGGWDNWDMVEIEKFPCKDKRELHTRERLNIEKYNSKLNVKIPTQTDKEYYNKNKDEIKKNRDNRKDIRKERGGVKIKCECGQELTKYNIAKHKRTKKHLALVSVSNE
jgi:hypothetical protein